MKKYNIKQYERQIIIKDIGKLGQQKINNSKILIIGLGGLGSTVATFLTRMGIGTICVIDDDKVDITNLHRQILYKKNNIGKNKITCGIKELKKINKSTEIIGLNGKVTEKNVNNLVQKYDLIIDCTDNFTTRGILNRACIKNKKTCIFGSVNNFEGYITVLYKGESPCYECLMGDFEDIKKIDNKKTNIGVLGSVVGMIGSMQATEAIKIILNIGDAAIGKLIVVNALDMTIQKIEYSSRKDCFCKNGKYQKY